MARHIQTFILSDKGIDRRLELRPEEQGYSIWINGKLRYAGQWFSPNEVSDRFYFLKEFGCTLEPVGNADPLLLVRAIRPGEQGIRPNPKGRKRIEDES